MLRKEESQLWKLVLSIEDKVWKEQSDLCRGVC